MSSGLIRVPRRGCPLSVIATNATELGFDKLDPSTYLLGRVNYQDAVSLSPLLMEALEIAKFLILR